MSVTTGRTPHTTESATTTSRRSRTEASVLAVFRMVVAFLFVCHGVQGFGAFGGIDGAGTGVPFGSWPGWWASVIEVGAGGLVLAGLFTRPAALLCSGAMAYAYFVVHQPTALFPLENMGEPAALYSWIFLLLAVFGPGRWAVDNVRSRSENRR
ncbi:DoxX family protein [Saccharomonospora cyanea]|uniref:Putative membrane protein n=1 Tax=Saccharomonospora cyanea NA-134 TaxID=882082 RepID=H5XDZ4_9PSEU|nr:DoxX family protein [Saccharomonospora cyanea]EHR59225.1 putative membrane protein [Saccharomonospora cyanea NA-134]